MIDFGRIHRVKAKTLKARFPARRGRAALASFARHESAEAVRGRKFDDCPLVGVARLSFTLGWSDAYM